MIVIKRFGDVSKCYVERKKNIGNKRIDFSDEAITLIVKIK